MNPLVAVGAAFAAAGAFRLLGASAKTAMTVGGAAMILMSVLAAAVAHDLPDGTEGEPPDPVHYGNDGQPGGGDDIFVNPHHLPARNVGENASCSERLAAYAGWERGAVRPVEHENPLTLVRVFPISTEALAALTASAHPRISDRCVTELHAGLDVPARRGPFRKFESGFARLVNSAGEKCGKGSVGPRPPGCLYYRGFPSDDRAGFQVAAKQRRHPWSPVRTVWKDATITGAETDRRYRITG